MAGKLMIGGNVGIFLGVDKVSRKGACIISCAEHTGDFGEVEITKLTFGSFAGSLTYSMHL